MSKEDLIRKLTSRKFWIALVGFITALCVLLNVDNGSAEKIVALVMAFGELTAYIIAEGIVDSNRGE